MALFDQVLPAYSMESIKQQSTVFFKELTSIIEDFTGQTRVRIHDGEFVKRIQACVKHHTGIEIDVDIGNPKNANDDFGPAALCIPPTVSKYFMTKKEASDFTESLVELKFNLNTGYVYGNTKRVKCVLYVNTEMLVKATLSPQEHAAVTLHEIGHLFFLLFYSTRLATTNIALEMAAKDWDAAKTEQDRETIYKRYQGSLFANADYEVVKQSDTKVMISLVLNSVVRTIKDDLGMPRHGYVMNEYVADMYAARHGAGLPLATGLQKIQAIYNSKFTYRVARFAELMRITKFIIIATTVVTNPLINPLAGLAIVILNLFIIVATAEASEMETRYDKPVDRYVRIRNQIQQRLRSTVKDGKEYQIYAQELAQLDEIIASTTNMGSTFDSWYSMVLSSSTRRRNRQSELVMFFEELAYNKLHEKALELKFA